MRRWCGGCGLIHALEDDYLCSECRAQVWWPNESFEVMDLRRSGMHAHTRVWIVYVPAPASSRWGSETFYWNEETDVWIGRQPGASKSQ